MRNLILILLLIPALASVGHDVYIFSQAPDKGFRFSDLGALWDKYHKESHDQWKNTVNDLGQTLEEGIEQIVPPSEPVKEPQAEESTPFIEGFSQTDEKNKETVTAPAIEETVVEENVTSLQKNIGFLLEQKAVIVFGGAALLFYFLTALLALPFKKKSNKFSKSAPMQNTGRKGGGYKYGRK